MNGCGQYLFGLALFSKSNLLVHHICARAQFIWIFVMLLVDTLCSRIASMYVSARRTRAVRARETQRHVPMLMFSP